MFRCYLYQLPKKLFSPATSHELVNLFSMYFNTLQYIKKRTTFRVTTLPRKIWDNLGKKKPGKT